MASNLVTLRSKLEDRFNDLDETKFGTFHEEIRRFFDFFDSDQSLSHLSSKLSAKATNAKQLAEKYKHQTGEKVDPVNDYEAAAVGEAFLRMVAGYLEPPRSLYDYVFNTDNPAVYRLGDQYQNDVRSLSCVKDRFLRPFRRFILDNLIVVETPEFSLADYDGVTGLLIRRVFDVELEILATQTVDEVHPMSLIMVDLDHFKAVNDTHGHPVGDDVLKTAASILQETVKGRGKAFRYGGEEFAVLLPNHSALEAANLAERIRTNICQNPISSQNIPVTASLGVAELDSAGQTDLVSRADQALYQAKKLGRNLVRMHGEIVPEPESSVLAVPSRKQPELKEGLDPEAAFVIRMNYFQSGTARCPFDSALLNVKERHIMGRKTADVLVSCRMCGMNELIEGPE